MRNLGFAIGMVLGAAAGLFLAPRRGEETRARLAQAAHGAADLAAHPIQSAATGIRERRGERARAPHGPCAPTL